MTFGNSGGLSPRVKASLRRKGYTPEQQTAKDDEYEPKLHSRRWKLSIRRCQLKEKGGRIVMRGGFACLCLILLLLASSETASRYQHTSQRIRDESVSLIFGALSQRRARKARSVVHVDRSDHKGKPRSLGYYFTEEGRFQHVAVPLGSSGQLDGIKSRGVEPMTDVLWSQMSVEKRREISDSYDKKRRGDGVEPPCVHQHAWQATSFPTCNNIHETDLSNDGNNTDGLRNPKFINHGGWVDIWTVPEYGGGKLVLKSMRYQHEFTDRNFDRYRRDSLVMERLTSAPNVLNIFGFCGVSALVDHSAGFDLQDVIDKRFDSMGNLDKLRIASQVMSSIAAVHNFDKKGQASIAHTDISPDQFLEMADGRFVLNDFNRARFIGWNEQTHRPCCFHVSRNPGRQRSPEEYRHDCETEKVDVYSAGNILYFILKGHLAWGKEKEQKVKKMVMRGERPFATPEMTSRKHPEIVAVVRAISMCWVHDPKKRPGARKIADLLLKELRKHE